MTSVQIRRLEAIGISLFLASTTLLVAQSREVVGYFPSWKWDIRHGGFTADRIPFGQLTIVNYAFYAPLADGRITGRNPRGDSVYLSADNTSLVNLAHKTNVRVYLSIGGWEDSGNFSAVSATPSTRAAFAGACADEIRRHRFDGIDIDWEYPCYPEHNGVASDRQNFTNLLRAVRDTLDALGTVDHRRYGLTAALPAGPQFIRNIEIDKIGTILDMLNIMTYDFNGPWERPSGHNAPLYSSYPSAPEKSVDAAFKLYVDTLHVPASKLNLGVPFYGHAFANCVGPDTPHGGEDHQEFNADGAFFANIAKSAPRFERRWDAGAKVPYLVDARRKIFVSYDDSLSVSLKAAYAKAHGAAGLIIWEITGDMMPDGSHPLLDAIAYEFRKLKD